MAAKKETARVKRPVKVPVKAKTPVKAKASAQESGDVTAEYEAALERQKTEHYVFRLYIAGNNLRSQMAVGNVKKICEEYLNGRYELDVIDIYQDQSKMPVDVVLAAPTLIRKLPLPVRRVIGDMTRKDKVLVGLDLVRRE